MKNWTKAAAAFAEFFVALTKSFEAQKVSDEKVGQILESKEFLEYCANFLNRAKNFLSILSDLSLTDLAHRIARGKYDWVNSDINEKNFPTTVDKDYEVEYRLFHYETSKSSDSAIAEMEKEGFRAGNLVELLKLGEIHPELQRKFPIVALGSILRAARDNRSVPVLLYGSDKRKLGLGWFDGNWGSGSRFLGVRLIAQASE